MENKTSVTLQNFPKYNFTGRRTQKSKKIKIGYVSNDFNIKHPICHLIKDLFVSHNKKIFEVYGYVHNKDFTKIDKKILNGFDYLVDITKVNNQKAAELIYKDGIDILIDLKGYTHESRLEIFAFRPAPIQVTYLGFPGTTGSDFIDYVVADKTVAPTQIAQYFTEKVIYLPKCYQINSKKVVSKKKIKRSDFHLPEDKDVFASFNSSHKITGEAFMLWMKILKKADSSVLWLLMNDDKTKNNFKKQAGINGVNPKRIIFTHYLPNKEHLARIKLADIVLDTLTYNGHTTTSDCIWSKVPVVTKLGGHFASRVSASILSTVGLKSLVAKNNNEYVRIASELALNPKKLKAVKKHLEDSKNTLPLFDIKTYVRELESSYMTIQKLYKDGAQPQSIKYHDKSKNFVISSGIG